MHRILMVRLPLVLMAAAGLLLLYFGIVVSPVMLVAWLQPVHYQGFISTMGDNAALIGFSIIAMQFLLSAQWKLPDRMLRLHVPFAFHKAMGLIGMFLVFSPPTFLAIGNNDWPFIFGPGVEWNTWLSRIALMVLLVHVVFVVFRFILIANYDTWLFVHNLSAVLVLAFGFSQTWKASGDIDGIWMKWFWAFLLLAASINYLWNMVSHIVIFVRGNIGRVAEMGKISARLRAVELQPPAGLLRFDYLPVQLHHIAFHRESPNTPDMRCSMVGDSRIPSGMPASSWVGLDRGPSVIETAR